MEKDYLKDIAREEAIFHDYKQKVNIFRKEKRNELGEIIEGKLIVETPKKNIYYLDEYLGGGLTENVILKFKDIELHFKKHLNAEIVMMILISEE